MQIINHLRIPITSESDIVRVRSIVRDWTKQYEFTLIKQTKLVTAASELARNTLIYGGGGELGITAIDKAYNIGLRLAFKDQGPGIANIELAMQDGYTSGKGMGMGLSGSKRLVDEFEINSTPNVGTEVTITLWK